MFVRLRSPRRCFRHAREGEDQGVSAPSTVAVPSRVGKPVARPRSFLLLLAVMRRIAAAAACLSLVACGPSTRAGDPPSVFSPGDGPDCMKVSTVAPDRIICQRNPASPSRRSVGDPAALPRIDVPRAVVTAIDTYDETADGKARGAVFVQDVGSNTPYSGVSLYRPTLLPASATPAPGDVFALTGGEYQETRTIGTTVDFKEKFLPQLSYATGNFVFEYVAPPPAEVTAESLNTFTTGNPYIGMLVKLRNVTVAGWNNDGKGRLTGALGEGREAAQISNELMDVASGVGSRTSFKSVTGVVTFFFTLKVAPRSMNDFEF